MKMSSQVININKHGKDYTFTIPEALSNELSLKERKKADFAVNGNVICISLSHDSDLILLTHRWEKLLNGILKQFGDYMLKPTRFAPPFKFVMFNIFKFIESIYFDCYGPDHLIRNFYYQNLTLLYVQNADSPEIKKMKKKLSTEFLKMSKKENTSDMSLKDKKTIMEYLESEEFKELLFDLSVLQSKWDLGHSRLESVTT
jgi:hypothetical protein